MSSEKYIKSLIAREEGLNFRRDLIEYSPESFSSEQIIELLREQRGVCAAMEREVREDFERQSPKMRELLLESLDGAGGYDRAWWALYLTEDKQR